VEVLSQSQIDDLLKSLSSGGMDAVASEDPGAKKVREYDFKSPKRFTREQLRIVSSVYENFSRLLSTYLTSMLRLFVEAEVVQIEELRYNDFNNALPDSILTGMGEIRFSGSGEENNTILFDIAKPIAFAVLERLLGGTGDGLDVDRDFTEIELSLMENIFKGLYPQMSDAWFNHFELDAVFRKMETNSRLIQAISADDTVVVVMIDAKVKDVSGNISICVPAVCLEDVLKRLDSQQTRNMRRINSSGDKERRDLVMQYLRESNLEMRCVIGKTEVTLADIYYLAVGDIIQLSKPVTSPVELNVGESCWFRGKMGVQRGKKAIQVKEVL
jgi:flagellar motor switch protein FliM